MKLQNVLAAALFASVAMLSVGAQAADTDKAAAAEVKAEPAAKAAKPHSHVQEKTGMEPGMPNKAAPTKKNAAKDKSKHYHPRDMK